MKKAILFVLLAVVMAGCGSPAPAVEPVTAATQPPPATHTALPAPTSTPTPLPTATNAPSPTPGYPPEGVGPGAFPEGYNPLTGLPVPADNLNRRPLLVKVENLPRNHRPQLGLNSADLVWEYYTEEGSTRFAALYYGSDAKTVAPIRSARYFDISLVHMYRANFVFGGAYERLWNRLVSSDFGARLVVEGASSCPALCRYDPNGDNFLAANTAEMRAYLQARNIDNSRQDLPGMFFRAQVDPGGWEGPQLWVRFSGAIYNRWDYDAASGRYLRFADAEDDISRTNPIYAPLTDRLSGEPVSAENVVVVIAPYKVADPDAGTEVLDVVLEGSGKAYLLRDGRMYELNWQRERGDSLLMLTGADGNPFALKPGRTWYEVVGASSKIERDSSGLKIEHVFP